MTEQIAENIAEKENTEYVIGIERDLSLRYISHVEDYPGAWSQSFSSMEEAISENCRAIDIHLDNGSGDVVGAVYDRIEKRVVAYCNPWDRAVTKHGLVTVTRLPNPDFLERCARTIEGFQSGGFEGIDQQA